MITSNFTFTNTSESKVKVTPVNIGVLDNYALAADEPNDCEYVNKTTPVDSSERLSYMIQPTKKTSTKLDVLHPATVESGVQYVIKVEDLLVTTSDADPAFRVDEPIVAYLTVRHGKSGNITAQHIETVLKRLLGAIYKEDGTTRFNELMRSALRITN